jgi:CDP-diacylglycerol--glycerol-3-phosphate 3-phosphatidyltransferase
LLIPVFLVFMYLEQSTKNNLYYILAAVVFFLASITDILDGYIARREKKVTVFGKVFDPIADKLLVLSALVILTENGLLLSLITIFLVAREILVSGFRIVMAEKGEIISASWLGKTKTVLQDVELLAIGSEVIQEDPESPRGTAKAETRTQPTATLAVMSFDAEKLVFADSRGKVRLALRRSDDKAFVSAKGVTGRAVMGYVPSDAPDERLAAAPAREISYEPASRPMPGIPPVIQEPLLPTMPAQTATHFTGFCGGRACRLAFGCSMLSPRR